MTSVVIFSIISYLDSDCNPELNLCLFQFLRVKIRDKNMIELFL